MNTIPKTLEEAIQKIDEFIKQESEETIKYIMKSENEFVALAHFGLGMYIRNNWGLWKQEGELYDSLIKIGLSHPDDMSGLLLTSYYRTKNNLPLQITDEIIKYKKYWEKAEGYTSFSYDPKTNEVKSLDEK